MKLEKPQKNQEPRIFWIWKMSFGSAAWKEAHFQSSKTNRGSYQDPHCKEISIYVFPEKELCGLSPIFHIHVSVSDLYIPMIDPTIFLQQ
jgi:hypothetical protein